MESERAMESERETHSVWCTQMIYSVHTHNHSHIHTPFECNGIN
jgi:hypothetical protein